mmetsp:Transcript_62636/g.149402  ORF Transcript_62636/g.149402 Transcript_62636/m.149402 type:complete len:126 (+) Transcript_62636:773-1150(+)
MLIVTLLYVSADEDESYGYGTAMAGAGGMTCPGTTGIIGEGAGPHIGTTGYGDSTTAGMGAETGTIGIRGTPVVVVTLPAAVVVPLAAPVVVPLPEATFVWLVRFGRISASRMELLCELLVCCFT